MIEDCFFTAGISLAATALAVTERLRVGLGILPAVGRNPAILAMELATLAGLAPGRVVGGLGHGVQSWMAQIGARQPSPVTALEEVLTAVRQLLAGETVTTAGRFVTLDDVTLDRPPHPPPPVLAGVRGPVSLAMAGRCADGLVLAEMTGPTAVREAIATAAPRRPFDVVVYSALSIDDDRRVARRGVAGWIVELVEAARRRDCAPTRSTTTSPASSIGAASPPSTTSPTTGGRILGRSGRPTTSPPISTCSPTPGRRPSPASSRQRPTRR